MSNAAPQRHHKAVSELRNVAVDLSGLLDVGELLTGTPTVLEVTTTALTLSSKIVNTTAITVNGTVLLIGQAVQFRVAGGLADTAYTVRITVGTNAAPAQTLVVTLYLRVVAD